MFSKIFNFWQILKSNLWFVPATYCLLFLGVTAGFYTLEMFYLKDFEYPKFFFQGTVDSARTVIVTLLSAMITMATLAISITMVVLSLAASQLGPRLIKTFMADRKTKDFIGMFFGSVMACFVLTVILHSSTSDTVTPQMTVSLVFVICLINLFVLLGFVNHVAQSSIADNVILKVSQDLKAALKRLTKDIVKQRHTKSEKSGQWPKDFDQMSSHIYFDRSGYVQNIDYDAIMDLACAANLRIKINFKAGHFLVKGEDGVRVYTKTAQKAEELQHKIEDAFIIGKQRTATQDIEYSIRHLVEIAIRALSPGINDSFTAINVLDHLSEALALLFEKETPSEEFFDDQGIKRMHAKQSDDFGIIMIAFDQIRFNGCGMPSILRHMLHKFKVLVELANDEKTCEALKQQLIAIADDLDRIEKFVPDREDMKSLTQQLIKQLS